MANPILSQRDAFTRTAPQYQTQYAQTQFGQGQYGQMPAYGQTPYGQAPYGQAPQAFGQAQPTMTMDDVVAKTGITMLVLVASAVATFLMLPWQLFGSALVVSSLVGLVTVFLVSSRKRINPALVLFYAVVEGVFIGAFSRMFESSYPGIVPQAVLGTFVAAFCTLAAYRFFNIRVSDRMRRMVFIGTAAFAGVMLVNFLLALLGIDLGLRSGAFGLVVCLLGAGLAVFNLVTDFDDIDRGIAGGAPANEAWRAAFGVTVTMVWLYTEVLRLLSYFRQR